jgi:hypothetical protein
MDHMHGPRTKTGLASHDTRAGHDQLVDRRLILEWAVSAISGDRTMDEPRIQGDEPGGVHEHLVAGGRGKILDQDISAAHQSGVAVSGILPCRLPGAHS